MTDSSQTQQRQPTASTSLNLSQDPLLSELFALLSNSKNTTEPSQDPIDCYSSGVSRHTVSTYSSAPLAAWGINGESVLTRPKQMNPSQELMYGDEFGEDPTVNEDSDESALFVEEGKFLSLGNKLGRHVPIAESYSSMEKSGNCEPVNWAYKDMKAIKRAPSALLESQKENSRLLNKCNGYGPFVEAPVILIKATKGGKLSQLERKENKRRSHFNYQERMRKRDLQEQKLPYKSKLYRSKLGAYPANSSTHDMHISCNSTLEIPKQREVNLSKKSPTGELERAFLARENHTNGLGAPKLGLQAFKLRPKDVSEVQAVNISEGVNFEDNTSLSSAHCLDWRKKRADEKQQRKGGLEARYREQRDVREELRDLKEESLIRENKYKLELLDSGSLPLSEKIRILQKAGGKQLRSECPNTGNNEVHKLNVVEEEASTIASEEGESNEEYEKRCKDMKAAQNKAYEQQKAQLQQQQQLSKSENSSLVRRAKVVSLKDPHQSYEEELPITRTSLVRNLPRVKLKGADIQRSEILPILEKEEPSYENLSHPRSRCIIGQPQKRVRFDENSHSTHIHESSDEQKGTLGNESSRPQEVVTQKSSRPQSFGMFKEAVGVHEIFDRLETSTLQFRNPLEHIIPSEGRTEDRTSFPSEAIELGEENSPEINVEDVDNYENICNLVPNARDDKSTTTSTLKIDCSPRYQVQWLARAHTENSPLGSSSAVFGEYSSANHARIVAEIMFKKAELTIIRTGPLDFTKQEEQARGLPCFSYTSKDTTLKVTVRKFMRYNILVPSQIKRIISYNVNLRIEHIAGNIEHGRSMYSQHLVSSWVHIEDANHAANEQWITSAHHLGEPIQTLAGFNDDDDEGEDDDDDEGEDDDDCSISYIEENESEGSAISTITDEDHEHFFKSAIYRQKIGNSDKFRSQKVSVWVERVVTTMTRDRGKRTHCKRKVKQAVRAKRVSKVAE